MSKATCLPMNVALIMMSTLPAPGFFNSGATGSGYAGNLGAGASTGLNRLAAFQNPAVIKPEHAGITLNYYRPFVIDDINISEVTGYWDKLNNGLSMSFVQTDVEDLYLEQSLTVQVARKMFSLISLGASAQLQRLEIKNYSYATFFGNSLGLICNPHPKFSLGLFVREPFASLYLHESIRQQIQVGGTLNTGKTDVSFDVCKNVYGNWSHMLGQNIHINKYLSFSLGLADAPYRFSLGMQLEFHGFHLNSAMQYHEKLGQTRFYGLSSEFKKKSRL